MRRLIEPVSGLLRSLLDRLGIRRRSAPTVARKRDMLPADPDAALAVLYASTNASRAISSLYDWTDHAMSAGEFYKVNALLARADTDRLNPDLSVAILSAVLPARGKLPSHRTFYERTFVRLAECDGETEARDCLKGLEPFVPVLFLMRVADDVDVAATVASLWRAPWIGAITYESPDDPNPSRRRFVLVEVDPVLLSLQTSGAFPGFVHAERVAPTPD